MTPGWLSNARKFPVCHLDSFRPLMSPDYVRECEPIPIHVNRSRAHCFTHYLTYAFAQWLHTRMYNWSREITMSSSPSPKSGFHISIQSRISDFSEISNQEFRSRTLKVESRLDNYVLGFTLLKVSHSRARIAICMTIDFSIKRMLTRVRYVLAFYYEKTQKMCKNNLELNPRVITINFCSI